MPTTHRFGPAARTETAAEWIGLPTGRIAERGDTAEVFVDSLDALAAWHPELGGHTTRQPAGAHVVLWTLTTAIPGGPPVHVHALALDTEQPDDNLLHPAAA